MKLGPVVLLLALVLGIAPAAAKPPKGAKPACKPGTERPVGTFRAAYAGIVKESAQAYREPGSGAFASFAKLNENGYPTTFSIVGAVLTRRCTADWYRVQLPLRPNGTTGYVRAGEILVQKVTTRLVIDVSDRRLTFYRGGRKVLATPVAVGAPATPTPTGSYYVNQRIVTTNPDGPFGPAALGVSAFSNVLTGWTQGGPIGIHGTNAPWSIGRAVSNGCIRVPNPILQRIFGSTLGGTPVIIRA